MRRRLTLAVGVTVIMVMSGCAGSDGKSSTATPAAGSTTSSLSSPTATSTTLTTTSTTTTATPTPTPVYQPGDVNPQVREVQARLRQLDFFTSYDVLDNYGPITQDAVSKYQQAKNLPVTGILDSATWALLQKETKAPSDAELKNMVPGATIIAAGSPSIRGLQVRLQNIAGFAGAIDGNLSPAVTAAVESFQKAQGIAVTGEVDQRTWDYLVSVTPEPAQWQLDGKSAPPEPTGGTMTLSDGCKRAIAQAGRGFCAKISENKLTYIVGDKVVMTLDAVFGSEEMPTSLGKFAVYYKSANGVTSTMFGSSIPMPYSMCFNGNMCIHYSVGFAQYGWGTHSHGCIGVRDMENIKVVFQQASVGDPVYIDA
ncbi:MAG: L,D-transpeptidase family protein [Propionibacteriaceae bacterium]